MNWIALIAGFAIALAVGAFVGRLLERNRPGWSARRRRWTAALLLPGFVLLATMAGIGFVLVVGPGTGENMQDLAVAVTAFVGLVFAFVAVIGGLAGATFAARQ